jgi:hypothetical protein
MRGLKTNDMRILFACSQCGEPISAVEALRQDDLCDCCYERHLQEQLFAGLCARALRSSDQGVLTGAIVALSAALATSGDLS